MRICLDTNVIFSGALSPQGPSSKLSTIKDKVTFLVSNYVINECQKVISKNSPNKYVKSKALWLIENYLSRLGAIFIYGKEDNAFICNHKDDQDIFDSAFKYNCNYICTYNIKDFPKSEIGIITPFALLRLIDNKNVQNFVQYPLLSDKGTLLVYGTLNHKSSMGRIIKSENGIEVYTDTNGYILLKGDTVKNLKTLKPLEGEKEFAMIIRYKPNFFQATRWSYNEDRNDWNKEVLTRVNCCFSKKTKATLKFEENHNFFGNIQNISGLPIFVKENKFKYILDNKSLEAVSGSIDIRYMLNYTIYDSGGYFGKK
jgi:putative PIN family toxin of toxin-antitoxin system